MRRFLINMGLFLFLTVSMVMMYIYIGLLAEKVSKPNFKNLDWNSFIVFGILVGLFAVADFFILKRLVKGIKREVSALKKEVGIK